MPDKNVALVVALVFYSCGADRPIDAPYINLNTRTECNNVCNEVPTHCNNERRDMNTHNKNKTKTTWKDICDNARKNNVDHTVCKLVLLCDV